MSFNRRSAFPRIIYVVLLLAVVVYWLPAAQAQSLLTGDINGTITDPSGAVIVDASVTLKSLDRGETQTAKTNSSGFYRFSLLKPGAYSVSVSQTGFRKTEAKLDVNVGQVTPANIILQLGPSSELVEVTSAAAIVNTDNANVATSFDSRIVLNTPNPGGDLTNIAQTAPGVTMNTSAGYGNLTANGLPATANLFTINGENNMDPFFNINNSGATNLTLGVNEIQEATVVTNPYSGQYGQQAGAQVTFITKSGTNDFHGSVRYDWNGRVLNANDWFANHDGTKRPFANANQWGADFGGPIFKNKTFFYVDTEGLRYVLPTVQNTFVVTPLYANAVLANIAQNQPASLPLYQKLFDVWTKAPGAANGTPQPGSCPTGSTALDTTLPFSATDACMTNFIATPNSRSSEWILSARVDQNIGNNDKLFFRFRRDNGTQATYTDPVNANFNATSKQPSYDGQANWTRVLGPTKTNQFLATLSWYSAPFVQNENLALSTFPFDVTFSGLELTNFARLRSFPQGRNVTQYQFIDDFTWMRGNHTLKFGVNFRRYDVSDHNFFYKHPRLLIDDLGAFYDGYVSEDGGGYVRQDFGPNHVVAPIAIYGVSFYAQDEWRVRTGLKLSLALRMEKNGNPVCQNHCFSRFSGPFESLTHGSAIPYNQNILYNLNTPFASVDAINFSPRLGFTWSPRSNDKTVISGGVGIFYDSLAQGLVESSFQNIPGYTDYRVSDGLWADPGVNGALSQLQTSAAALDAGFPNGASYSTLSSSTQGVFRRPTFSTFTGKMHTPQYQEWNVQVQHALSGNMSVNLNYFGTHGIFIPVNNSMVNAWDAYGYGAGLPTSRPDGGYNIINEFRTVGVSNSNGLTATFVRRFSRGVSVQANYTWSHALDEVSNGGGFVYGADSFLSQFNPTSLRANNYGNADYDIRHNFSSNLLWQPTYKANSRVLNHILGNWSFSGTIFARTALPYTILDTNSIFAGCGTYAGLCFIPGQAIGPGATFGQQPCVNGDSQCFDINSFVDANVTPYSVFPTQRRNQYRGPNFFNANFNVVKNFPITERVKFALAANFYNVFNHPNFANPNWALAEGDGTVGKILSTVSVPASPYGSFVGAAAAPRLVQFEGRLTF